MYEFFCSRYLQDVETRSNRSIQNNDGGNNLGRPIRKGAKIYIDDVTWEQAHHYVLQNIDAITPIRM